MGVKKFIRKVIEFTNQAQDLNLGEGQNPFPGINVEYLEELFSNNEKTYGVVPVRVTSQPDYKNIV